jgi:hypothetical protein
MSIKTPKEVFKAIKDRELLEQLARSRKLELTDKVKKNLVTYLADEVSNIGMKKLLNTLTKDLILKLASKMEWEGKEEGPKSKPVFIKRIDQSIVASGAREFFNTLDESVLRETVKKATNMEKEEEATGTKKELIDQILAAADEFGLDNAFSVFSVAELQKFAAASDLKVQSSSADQIITSILNHQDYKPPKKVKKKIEKPSKDKQDIKKGISKADLQQWYYRAELSDWCKDHGLKPAGSKAELIRRVYAKLNNLPLTNKDYYASDLPPKKGVKRNAAGKEKKEEGTEKNEAPKKKGRGRPRKNVEVKKVEKEEEQSAESESPKKKKQKTENKAKASKSGEKSEKMDISESEKSEKSEKAKSGSDKSGKSKISEEAEKKSEEDWQRGCKSSRKRKEQNRIGEEQ